MPVSLLLFDLDGVLCGYDQADFAARLAALTGRSPEAIQSAIWDSGFDDDVDAGVHDVVGHLDGINRHLGSAISENDWVMARRASTEAWPRSLALAARLKKRTRIGILSNNSLLLKKRIGDILPALLPVFGAAIFTSAELRARKPEPSAFLRCLARLNALPGETMFVDDVAANIEGAISAGLYGHVFSGVDRLERQLIEAGVL